MTWRVLLLAALLAPAAPTCAAALAYHDDLEARACCVFIAHAGGGIDGAAYTNSQEALLANLRAGRRVFEIDFSRTADGVWVGTHDWSFWSRQTGQADRLPPTYAQFTSSALRPVGAQTASGPYTAITIPFLEDVAKRHRDMLIVSDTKYDLEALARALRETSIFNRVYAQAYSPRDVEMLERLGYHKIILTLYKMNLRQPDAVLRSIAPVLGRLHALTVPLDFFEGYHARLTQLGLPVYIHGTPSRINSRELHRRLRRLGASGFYLDW